MNVLILALLLSQTEAPAPAAAAAAKPAADEDEKAILKEIRDSTRRLAEAAERITPPPPPEAEKATPPKWASNVTAGLTWVTGNVTSFSFVGTASTTRKVDKTIFVGKAFAGYGEKLIDPTIGPNEVLLYNMGGSAQFDYRFTPLISGFI